MEQIIFVVWRESVEALLVIGLMHALLKQQDNSGLGLRYLWWGIAGGLVLALTLAISLLTMSSVMGGNSSVIFSTFLVLVASILIVQMVLWMRTNGRHLHSHFKQKSNEAMASGKYWSIAVLAAVALGREGSETVIFLYGMSSAQQAASDWVHFASAVAVAFALAGFTYWLLQASGRWLSWRLFFRLSEALLLLLAASLIVTGVDRLIGLGWLPAGLDPVWDTSNILDDSSRFGSILSALTGYRAYPALTDIVAYFGFWIIVATLLVRQNQKLQKKEATDNT
tara:strand:- start:2930 stop:3775 length:846 start_codon:yes stop_codon:yes gene_type:complete